MFVPFSFAEQEIEFNKSYNFSDFFNSLLKNDNWNEIKKMIFLEMLVKEINTLSEKSIVPIFNNLIKKDTEFAIKILKILKFKDEILFQQ